MGDECVNKITALTWGRLLLPHAPAPILAERGAETHNKNHTLGERRSMAIASDGGPARGRFGELWRNLPRSARALPLAAVLVPLSILALVGWLNWRAAWRNAEADILRAAESVAEYGKRAFESYSLAAGRLNERLRGLADAEIRENERALHDELRRTGAELTQTELAYVIDREGRALIATNIFPVPREVSLADRDYFQGLLSPDFPPAYVSRMFIGRFDGQLLFSVARRREDTGNPPAPDGFDGVVLVSVRPQTLAEGMRRLLHAPTDRMALMRADGYAVSTTSGLLDQGRPPPRVDPSSPYFKFADAGVESAVYLSRTATPGADALLAMHRIEGFPMYGVAIRPASEIVAGWWSVMSAQLALGLPATLGLLLLSLRVARDQRRLATKNVALRRDNDLSSDRLVRAKRFGLVGTFEFDLRTGISRRSPEYISVHGLPAAAAEEGHDDWAKRLHPDDRRRAEGEVLRALSDDSDDVEYAQTYRIVTPQGEVRWIAARGEIERDAAGRATMLRGAHVDVTPLRTTEMALAESDARLRMAQEAVGIGAWEWRGVTRSLNCSAKTLEIFGFDPLGAVPDLGAVLGRLHLEDRLCLRDALREIRRSGGFSGELRLLRPDDAGAVETVWIAVRAKAMTLPGAVRPVVMGIVYDVTERKRADELTALMTHEVEHRAKNALAIVSSLLRMTKADSAEELAEAMTGRVRALSQTMGLLGRGRWKGALLRDIVMSELAPFESPGSEGPGIAVSGPALMIDVNAAQPLSMALHELATNAAKYGALSTPGGRLSVEWRIDGGRAHLVWRESGGPRLDGAPAASGFGSKLIAILFEGQLGGEAIKRWEPSGLVCEMSFPVPPQL